MGPRVLYFAWFQHRILYVNLGRVQRITEDVLGRVPRDGEGYETERWGQNLSAQRVKDGSKAKASLPSIRYQFPRAGLRAGRHGSLLGGLG